MKKKLLTIFLTIFSVGIVALALKNTFMPESSHLESSAKETKELYFCPMHPNYTSDRPGSCPICHMDLVRAERDAHASDDDHSKHADGSEDASNPPRVMTVEEIMSMKPGEICLLHKCKMGTCMIAMTEEWARLGKCPHCGEDLGVIIKDAMPDGYGQVKLSLEKQQLVGLQTDRVRYEQLIKTIRAAGTVAYDPELYQAQAEYLQATRSLNDAKQGKILEVIEQAERLVQTTEIRLRHFGLGEDLIEEISKQKGPDRSLLFSVKEEPAWVYAQVYEYELPMLQVGQSVTVEASSLGHAVFPGVLKGIDSSVDSATRTIRIRVKLLQADERLKPDMFVNVMVRADIGQALSVPVEAIFDTGTRKLAFVQIKKGVFEPREVKTGAKTDKAYEVLSGLNEGEEVVTSGNFLIDSESRLRSALQTASTGEHQHG